MQNTQIQKSLNQCWKKVIGRTKKEETTSIHSSKMFQNFNKYLKQGCRKRIKVIKKPKKDSDGKKDKCFLFQQFTKQR